MHIRCDLCGWQFDAPNINLVMVGMPCPQCTVGIPIDIKDWILAKTMRVMYFISKVVFFFNPDARAVNVHIDTAPMRYGKEPIFDITEKEKEER